MNRLPEFVRAGSPLYSLIVVSFIIFWNLHPAYAGQEHPCSDDIAKYCKGLQPGEGSIIECLQNNESKLSAECRSGLEESRKRFEATEKACATDVAKFCKDIKLGGGRIARCLAQHADELSPECCAKCDLAREKKKE